MDGAEKMVNLESPFLGYHNSIYTLDHAIPLGWEETIKLPSPVN